MDFSKEAKVWQLIAEECSSPGEFLRVAMAIRRENADSLSKKLGTSPAYVNMIRTNNASLGFDGCLNFSVALNINPFLLNRINCDYKMKNLIERTNTDT